MQAHECPCAVRCVFEFLNLCFGYLALQAFMAPVLLHCCALCFTGFAGCECRPGGLFTFLTVSR